MPTIEEKISALRTAQDRKQWAQDQLMDGISKVLGYWSEDVNISEEKRAELQTIMKQQADRIARLFGYNEAWRS